MKILKLILIAVLVAVTALYALTGLNQRLSGADVPPTIQCSEGVLSVSVNDGEDVLLAGVTASDKQDGDLTGSILIQGVSKLLTNNTAKVTYIVFDSHGNAATCTRQICYTDYRKPVFAVTSPLVYTEHEDIALLDRLKAVDVIDGDITESIRVSALSPATEPEVQHVTVQVTNSMGDTARVTLPLVVYTGMVVRPDVNLTCHLVYISAGDDFRATDYLAGVSTPIGPGKTADVEIIDTVNPDDPGTYYVYYRYPYSGTSGLSVLTVVVQ